MLLYLCIMILMYSSEKCLAEKVSTIDEDQMTIVGATEMANKDIDISTQILVLRTLEL